MVCIDPSNRLPFQDDGANWRPAARAASQDNTPTHSPAISIPKFSLSPTTSHPASATTKTIYSYATISVEAQSNASPTSVGSSSDLSDGSIAGLAIGGVAALFILVVVLSCLGQALHRRRRRARMPPPSKRVSRWQVSGPQTPPWSNNYAPRGPGNGVGFSQPSQPSVYPKMQTVDAGIRKPSAPVFALPKAPNHVPSYNTRTSSTSVLDASTSFPYPSEKQDMYSRNEPHNIGIAFSPDTPYDYSPESVQSMDSTTNLLPTPPPKALTGPVKHSPKRPPRPPAPWTIYEDHREQSPVKAPPQTPPPAITVTYDSPAHARTPSHASTARANESKTRKPSPPQLVIPLRHASIPQVPMKLDSQDPFTNVPAPTAHQTPEPNSRETQQVSNFSNHLQLPHTPLTPKTPVTNALQYYLQPPPSATGSGYGVADESTPPLPRLPHQPIDSPTLGNSGALSYATSSLCSQNAEARFTYISSAPQSPALFVRRSSRRMSRQKIRESDGSETSFESILTVEEITPPENNRSNPLSPTGSEKRPLSVEKPEKPIVDVNYPKVPRSANQKIARSPGHSPQASMPSTLLQKRVGSANAGALESKLIITESNISRMPTPVNEPRVASPQRGVAATREAQRALRESTGNGNHTRAMPAQYRSPTHKPSGRMAPQLPNPQLIQTDLLYSPTIGETSIAIKSPLSPMWEPRLTPRRVGEDLILEVSRGKWDR